MFDFIQEQVTKLVNVVVCIGYFQGKQKVGVAVIAKELVRFQKSSLTVWIQLESYLLLLLQHTRHKTITEDFEALELFKGYRNKGLLSSNLRHM